MFPKIEQYSFETYLNSFLQSANNGKISKSPFENSCLFLQNIVYLGELVSVRIPFLQNHLNQIPVGVF